jgi:hypothetical protein
MMLMARLIRRLEARCRDSLPFENCRILAHHCAAEWFTVLVMHLIGLGCYQECQEGFWPNC